MMNEATDRSDDCALWVSEVAQQPEKEISLTGTGGKKSRISSSSEKVFGIEQKDGSIVR